MRLADLALNAKRLGDVATQVRHASLALDLELRALGLAVEHGAGQQTQSVLRRSATFLAIDAHRFREGEDLVVNALSACDEDATRDHWFSLLEQVRGSRHLEVKGQQLADVDLQLTLVGKSVQPGFAPAELVTERVANIRSLMIRHSQRLAHLPFGDDSAQSRQIKRSFKVLQSMARAASYAVSLRFTQSTEQLALNIDGEAESRFLEATKPQNVLRDVMQSAEWFVRGGFTELATHMDKSYARAIGGLLQQLSPDRKRLDVVGLTFQIGDMTHPVTLPPRRELSSSAVLTQIAASKPTQPFVQDLVGELLKADSMKKPRRFQLRLDDQLKAAEIRYDADRFDDIVQNFWEKRVAVTVERRGTVWMLTNIDAADE